MAHLVLSVVGDDRTDLVKALADVVASHGGNWEKSELAELAGAFAGVVLVSVADDRRDALISALEGLEGMLRVSTHSAAPTVPDSATSLSFTVLGNDRPGIVRDVTAVIGAQALSIDSFTSRTLDAPMAGGTLFEARVTVRLPAGGAAEGIVRELERLADEIQVDLSLS